MLVKLEQKFGYVKMLIGLPSAHFLPNPMLVAVKSNKMNVYQVQFAGMYPVGNCLIIKAKDLKEAKKIASDTIRHTDAFTVSKVDMSKSGIIIYLSGGY